MAKAVPQLNTSTTEEKWVWRCSRASISQRRFSILALVEIPLAILVYGAVAYYLRWPFVQILQLLAAPLLLLRSGAGVRTGEFLFIIYGRKTRPMKLRAGQAVFATVLSSVLAFILLHQRPAHPTIVVAIFSGLIYGLACFTFEWIVIGAAGPGSSSIARVLAVATATVYPTFDPTFVVSTIGAVEMIRWTYSHYLKSEIAVAAIHPIFIVFTIPFVIGTWLQSLFIRVVATFLHLLAGARSLPANLRENLFILDFLYPAQLIPGDSKSAISTSATSEKYSFREGSVVGRALGLASSAVIQLSAIAFRWSLKSTSWFWWPILLVFGPAEPTPPRRARERTANMVYGVWSWQWLPTAVVSLWLAFSTIPVLSRFRTVLPDNWSKLINALSVAVPAVPSGVRLALLCGACVLGACITVLSKNLSASHDSILKSPVPFGQLTPEELENFLRRSAKIATLRTLLIVDIVLLGQFVALKAAIETHPGFSRVFAPWFTSLL